MGAAMAGFEVLDSDGEDDFSVRLDVKKHNKSLERNSVAKVPNPSTYGISDSAKTGLSRALTMAGSPAKQPVVVVPARKRPKSFDERTSRGTSDLPMTAFGTDDSPGQPVELSDNNGPLLNEQTETQLFQSEAPHAVFETRNDEEQSVNPTGTGSFTLTPIVDQYPDSHLMEQDELSMANAGRLRRPESESPSSKKRKAGTTNLGCDDPDVGVPPELYKPRSSRSQAKPYDEEPSLIESPRIPPDSGSAKKIKRRKTDGALLKRRRHDSDDESDVIQIEKPKRGRPKKNKTVEARQSDIAPTVATSGDIWDVDYSNVAETSGDIEAANHDSTAALIDDTIKSAPVSAEEKMEAAGGKTRKPRGRPKKSVLIDLVDGTDSDGESGDIEAKIKSDADRALQDISNIQQQTSEPAIEPATVANDGKENKVTMPETPRRTKGPDKHSPLQSSKLQYRVGLSKTHRIEPLLRIKRK